jgi:hypothetical protein
MNIRHFISKNAEAVFLVAAVAGLFGSYATSERPVIGRDSAPAASAAIDPAMQVVIIKGKRLSAAEKAALA